jgi:hypothetical protein
LNTPMCVNYIIGVACIIYVSDNISSKDLRKQVHIGHDLLKKIKNDKSKAHAYIMKGGVIQWVPVNRNGINRSVKSTRTRTKNLNSIPIPKSEPKVSETKIKEGQAKCQCHKPQLIGMFIQKVWSKRVFQSILYIRIIHQYMV